MASSGVSVSLMLYVLFLTPASLVAACAPPGIHRPAPYRPPATPNPVAARRKSRRPRKDAWSVISEGLMSDGRRISMVAPMYPANPVFAMGQRKFRYVLALQ